MSFRRCEYAPAYFKMCTFTFANHCTYLGVDSKIQCEYCPALYERKGSLDRHMAKYHPDKIVPDESEVQGETDTTNQGNLLRGIDNCLDAAQSVAQDGLKALVNTLFVS